MLPILLTLVLPDASATVRTVSATAQATNVLRYSVRVTTTETAKVALQVWRQGTAATSGWTTPYTTTDARVGTVELWGMRPGTRYNYRVLVDPVVGANYTDATPRNFTTAALPADIPSLTATTYAGAPDFDYLLFETRTTDTNDGLLLIVDNTGAVVWYQYGEGTDDFLVADYDADEEAVYAIVGVTEIARYAMNGTRTLDWDVAGELDAPPHHELVRHDGILYTLTTRSFTQGPRGYIEDGIQGYDSAGNLVYEWWSREDGGLSVTANVPYIWDRAGGPWLLLYPTQYDWTHANALQVIDEGGQLKAYISYRSISQIAKVDMATGVIEWMMGDTGSGSSGSPGDFTLDPSGVSTDWWAIQHHGHWSDDGTFMIFDNSLTGTTRQLEVDIDEAALEATITRSVDFSEFVDGSFDGWCDREGGVFRTTNGHLLATCGPEFLITDYNSSNVLQWSLDVGTTTAIYRATPLSSIGN